jgi:hypothetical protein
VYSYTLLKQGPDGTIDMVEPNQEIATLDALRAIVEEHIGMVPEWLANVPEDEYLMVEDWQGDFILDIEGAEIT